MDWLELKVPPALSFVLTGLLMWVSSACFPSFESVGWFSCLLGWVAFSSGGLLCVLGLLAFISKRTTPDPRDPHQTSTLVCGGIYQYSRNPMYLGFVVILVSFMLWLGSPLLAIYIAGFVAFLTRFQIKPEERILRYRFGQAYQDYMNQVPRWFKF